MQKNKLKEEIKQEFKKREFETKKLQEEEDEDENTKFISDYYKNQKKKYLYNQKLLIY